MDGPGTPPAREYAGASMRARMAGPRHALRHRPRPNGRGGAGPGPRGRGVPKGQQGLAARGRLVRAPRAGEGGLPDGTGAGLAVATPDRPDQPSARRDLVSKLYERLGLRHTANCDIHPHPLPLPRRDEGMRLVLDRPTEGGRPSSWPSAPSRS